MSSAISSTLGSMPAPTVAASEATNYGSTIEVALFVAAVLFTLLVVAALFFGVFRHAHLDSDGRVPTDHDDRSAA